MPAIQQLVRILHAKGAETLDVFGATMTILSDTTNLPVMLGEQIVPPGYAVPMHVHEHDDEVFLMLSGELTAMAGATETRITETRIAAGACVELPRGVPHGFRNDGAGPARLYVMATPGQHALAMFRHFDRVGQSGRPLAPEDIAGIAAQYGVRFV